MECRSRIVAGLSIECRREDALRPSLLACSIERRESMDPHFEIGQAVQYLRNL